MKLHEIKRVFETESQNECNEYLELGWQLIEVYKTCYDPDAFPNHQTVHYVLGWNKDEPAKKPPDKYADLILR